MMRPTALDILRGVRALLLEEVLPEVAAPQLRTQVALAIGLLDAAAVELDDAPAAYAADDAGSGDAAPRAPARPGRPPGDRDGGALRRSRRHDGPAAHGAGGGV